MSKDPGLLPLGIWRTLSAHVRWIYEGPAAATQPQGNPALRSAGRAWKLLAGSVVLRSASGVLRAGTGEWLILPSEEATAVFAPGSLLRSIAWHCQWPDGTRLFREPDGVVVRPGAAPRLDASSARLLRLVRHSVPTAGIDLLAHPTSLRVAWAIAATERAWFDAWADAMLGQGRSLFRDLAGDGRMLTVLGILDAAPVHGPWPAIDLQRATGLGLHQIDRLCRSHLGQTACSYHEGRRATQAKRLLLSCASPIKTIAFQLGFRQASHFTRWFSRQAGVTPADYRAAMQRNAPEPR